MILVAALICSFVIAITVQGVQSHRNDQDLAHRRISPIQFARNDDNLQRRFNLTMDAFCMCSAFVVGYLIGVPS